MVHAIDPFIDPVQFHLQPPITFPESRHFNDFLSDILGALGHGLHQPLTQGRIDATTAGIRKLQIQRAEVVLLIEHGATRGVDPHLRARLCHRIPKHGNTCQRQQVGAQLPLNSSRWLRT
ncbi:MAG: hypothetical protein IPG11_18055 [Flavobacteriales bacterium]|nr:hypothetical protein [Flavobacteriales bacterium]